MKVYSPDYEDGKCPLGYEYVAAYRRKDGRFINTHCRKLPKHRIRDNHDPGMSVVEIENSLVSRRP